MSTERRSWDGHRQITLNDVAKESGVSQSAASVVLNGAKSGTRISAHRRRAVLEAAERMGYRPNGLARSLMTGRTNRIGVYSGGSHLDSRNSFFAELLGGILVGTAEFGQNTMIHTSSYDDKGLLDLVSNRVLDGLVLHASEDDPIIPLLCELRVPAVAVADTTLALPSVVVDDVSGGILQAQHLASLGHRHVMVKQCPWSLVSATTRMVSFIETAERLGIRVEKRYELRSHLDIEAEEFSLFASGPDRVTAIVAWSDHLAQRICVELETVGFSVPGDVAVVGFDGFVHSCIPRFQLTSIRAPWAEVGRIAVSYLNSLTNGESVPSVTTLPVEFVRGATT